MGIQDLIKSFFNDNQLAELFNRLSDNQLVELCSKFSGNQLVELSYKLIEKSKPYIKNILSNKKSIELEKNYKEGNYSDAKEILKTAIGKINEKGKVELKLYINKIIDILKKGNKNMADLADDILENASTLVTVESKDSYETADSNGSNAVAYVVIAAAVIVIGLLIIKQKMGSGKKAATYTQEDKEKDKALLELVKELAETYDNIDVYLKRK
ncbi:MAG: hypothetical protein IJ583_09650 [Firmicutes bacterium]|nr:hypothetical protein [Bacillota bacterium]